MTGSDTPMTAQITKQKTEGKPVKKYSLTWFRKQRRRRIKKAGKNLIRRLAGFLSRQSLVKDVPIYSRADTAELFPFVASLEENCDAIRAELDKILKHRHVMPNFQDISPDQKKISYGDNWQTFILYGFGSKSEKNCAQVPVTSRLLEQVPNLQTAWFSIMSPRYHVPAHRGVTKGILRCHLGVKVPRTPEKCFIRVADEKFHWEYGKATVFDDTYEHEVFNNTDDQRVVLLFDFDRPMRWPGRALSKMFLRGLKMTAYYQDPKKNMKDYEERFEAAVRQMDKNLDPLND